VGGSTRIPAVRRAVAELFQREPDVSQHPDEAIALGATIQGGVMSGALQKMVLLDVTPLSLGIETFGGLMNVLIPRNTTIPCKAGEMFTNAADGQAAMRVRCSRASAKWPATTGNSAISTWVFPRAEGAGAGGRAVRHR
jgi:molecular chaperone DnaK